MKVRKNAPSNNNKPPLSPEDAQKIVSSLNGIWDMIFTLIREHESPLNNQGRNDPCLNPDTTTYFCNNHEKKHEETTSKGNPIGITTNDANNVSNTSTVTTDDSRDIIKRKEINHGTLKGKSYRNRKGNVGAKKSRKSTDSNNTGEVQVNTVKLLPDNEQVTKVVTTSSNFASLKEKSEFIPSLKRKGYKGNVSSRQKRRAEVVAQKIVLDFVSNKENGNSEENDSKMSEEISYKTHQQQINSDNQNKTEEGNKSSDIILISDEENNSKKPKNKGTTVKVCDAKNKNTTGDIDGDTLDKLRILNDISIKPARSTLKNVSISSNQSLSSLTSSTSPLSTSMPKKSSSLVASKPEQPGTSNLPVQEPVVSLSHFTTPRNLPILKKSKILVTSKSSALSLILKKSLAHTSTSETSPQGSILSPHQSPTSLVTPINITEIPVFSSPTIPVTDKPSQPTVNQRKHLSTLRKLARRPSQLSTSTQARCDSLVTIQPVPSSTSFTAQRPSEAQSHFNTALNLSISSISSQQKSSTQSHKRRRCYRRERTRSNSPAQMSIHSHRPPKPWHTPVSLTSETTSQTISSTFVQASSPAASSFEASCKQRSIALANSVISSNPQLSITYKSPIQPGIPPQTVQASSPAPTNSFESPTFIGERSNPPSSSLIKPNVTRPAKPSSIQSTRVPKSRKSRSKLPARPSMLYMPNKPSMSTIPTHSEIDHRAPGTTLDVFMRGIPSLHDPNYATNQAIDNIVREYYYKSLLMSLPCLPNEIIRGLVSTFLKRGRR